jgi:glycine betaine/proline transport system ATP-binding protein
MREHQTSRLFVIDRNQKLCGAVDEEAVVAAISTQAKTLDGVLDKQVASVAENTHINDVLALSADNPKALAVVDDERRVVGVLARVTLLQALAQRRAKAQTNAQANDGRPAEPSVVVDDSTLAEGALR